MQNYEIALIINPDLSKDIDKFFTSFEKLLSDNNFSISRLEDVGRRKLAYSIDDHNKGHYLFYYVEGTPENVSEIENKIKILLNTVSRDEYLCLLETMGYLLLLTQNHHMDYQQRQLYLHQHIQYQQSQEQYSFLPLESSML